VLVPRRKLTEREGKRGSQQKDLNSSRAREMSTKAAKSLRISKPTCGRRGNSEARWGAEAAVVVETTGPEAL